MEDIDTLTIDIDADALTKSNAEPGPRSVSFNNNYMLKRLKSVKKMQHWWRKLHHQTSVRREKLQKVHIATFAVSLFIRLAVVAYLSYILFMVADAITYEKVLDPTNAGDTLERTVLFELLFNTFGGYCNIIVCGWVRE